jgi:hypothetical protein
LIEDGALLETGGVLRQNRCGQHGHHDNSGAIFKAFLIPGSFLFLNERKLWLDFGGLSIHRRPA